MLYAGCQSCRGAIPLCCSGQFMMHMPAPVGTNGAGFFCRVCGPVPPILTCPYCWTAQVLFLPGAMPVPAGAAPSNIAPVVQAPAGASKFDLQKMLENALTGIGTKLVEDTAGWVSQQVSG